VIVVGSSPITRSSFYFKLFKTEERDT